MVVAVVAATCEDGPSGSGSSVTTEESLVELWGAVTMVPGGLLAGRVCRDSLGDGSWTARTSALVSAKVRRKLNSWQ